MQWHVKIMTTQQMMGMRLVKNKTV